MIGDIHIQSKMFKEVYVWLVNHCNMFLIRDNNYLQTGRPQVQIEVSDDWIAAQVHCLIRLCSILALSYRQVATANLVMNI